MTVEDEAGDGDGEERGDAQHEACEDVEVGETHGVKMEDSRLTILTQKTSSYIQNISLGKSEQLVQARHFPLINRW